LPTPSFANTWKAAAASPKLLEMEPLRLKKRNCFSEKIMTKNTRGLGRFRTQLNSPKIEGFCFTVFWQKFDHQVISSCLLGLLLT
jgi:hypothetical protein